MVETVILTKILEDKECFSSLLDHNVKPEYFQEQRNIYNFVLSFYREYGELPKLDVVKKNYPSFEPQDHSNGFDYWLGELHNRRITQLQNNFVEAYLSQKKAGASPQELSKLFAKVSLEVLDSQPSVRDVNLKDTEREKAEYQKKKEVGGLTGIKLGFPTFDNVTGGSKKGQLGILVGLPKNKKTWSLLFAAYNTWTAGERPLLISKEMSKEEMRDRLAWFDGKFSYPLFVRGQLDKRQEEKYFKALESRKSREDFIISADDGDMDQGSGVSLVAAKIERYKPTIVFIDGAYLLNDDRTGGDDWKSTRNVFRDLKRLARRKQIPVIGTTQPQRLKEKDGSPLRRRLSGEDIGGSYTITQDCDWMVGVRVATAEIIENYVIAIREGKSCDWQLLMDLETGRIEEVQDKLAEEEFATPEELRDEELRFT